MSPRRQEGYALLMAMIILAMGTLFTVLTQLEYYSQKWGRAIISMNVMTQAKEALLGYAATYRDMHADEVFGYLPCPDFTGDGIADPNVNGRCSAIDGQAEIGLLPYQTLGLPDLRDSDGVCLWYAVSGTFKAATNKPTPMNWDTQGQFAITGTSISPGAGDGGAAAVIFATGAPLSGQARSSSNAGPCAIDPTQVPHYLDGDYNFATNATISITPGIVRDANDNVTINDLLTWITPKEIFDRVAKRSDFGTPLAALARAIKIQIENKSAPAAYLTTPDYSVPGKITGALTAGLVSDATQSNYYNNWSNQYRVVLCSDTTSPCFQINDASGVPNCGGALVFGGRTSLNQNNSGASAGQPRQAGWLADARYFFESVAGALNLFTADYDVGNAASFSFYGNANYDKSKPSADIAYCLFPKSLASIDLNTPGTAAAFAAGTVGGGNPIATVSTIGTPSVTLGNATTVAGSGCVWYPTPIPIDTSLRIYFRYQVSTFGPGFTLALADAATNNPASTDPIMCGAATSTRLGYAGAPTSGTATVGATTVWISATSWSSSTGKATITTTTNHGFTAGQAVSVAGASPSGYNGTYAIASATSTSPYRFTYVVANPGPAAAGINPPKVALEFDMDCNSSRNDPPSGCGTPHHYAFDYWGSAADNDPSSSSATRDGSDDVTHNTGVLGDGSQPLNPRTYPITSATLNPVANITAAQWSGGVVAVTTSAPHGFAAAQNISITDVSVLGYKGSRTVATVPDATHFTYALAADPGPYPYIATVSAASWSNAITAATWQAGTATITTSAAHGLTTGQTVTVSGVTPSAWNGAYTATVLDSTRFTYALAANPGSEATGGQIPGALTTSSAHGLTVGQQYVVTVADSSPSSWNGTYTVTATDATHLSHTIAANPGSYVSGGQISFPLSAVAGASWLAGTATIATATHRLVSGQYVTLSGLSPAGYNGVYRVTVTDATHFTATIAANPGAYTSGGYASLATIIHTASDASWSASPGKATIATAAPHGLATGQTVTLSAIAPGGYNGTYAITVTDATHFTYALAADPGTFTAAGTLTYGANGMTSMVMPASVVTSTINSASWAATAGGTATLTTAAAHNLASDQRVNITGIYPSGFNGEYAVTVTDATHFTYALAADPGGSFAAGSFASPGIATTTMPTSTDIHVRLDLQRTYNAATHQAMLSMKAYIGNPTSASFFCLTADFQDLTRELSDICSPPTITLEQDGIAINDVVGPALANIYLGLTNSRGTASGDNQSVTIYDLRARSQ